MMQALARAIAMIDRGTDWRETSDAMRAFCQPHGYDRLVIWSVASRAEDVVGQIHHVEGDWFGSGEPIDTATYLRRCPVNLHIFKTEKPFFWTKQEDSYRLTTSPRGPGLHGLQVPVFGAAGLKGAVSFGGNRIDSSLAVRLALVSLAGGAFAMAERLADTGAQSGAQPESSRLSPREREVLRWIAAGRRQADAAQLLGLSERTVENHLRRIRHRLGVSTTAEAIRVTVSSGEIET